MDARIKSVVDFRRGCGWRDKRGALYLVCEGAGRSCGKLPIPLARVCECCGQLVYDVVVDGSVIGRSRSHRKLENPAPLINRQKCKDYGCAGCPLYEWPENTPALLQWIGEQHYPLPTDFTKEAEQFGVSRRIRGVPPWFELGRTWVFIAHAKSIPLWENMMWNMEHKDSPFQREDMLPAIFHVFKPTRIEVICDGTETEDEIDKYLDKGYTPVLVERAE